MDVVTTALPPPAYSSTLRRVPDPVLIGAMQTLAPPMYSRMSRTQPHSRNEASVSASRISHLGGGLPTTKSLTSATDARTLGCTRSRYQRRPSAFGPYCIPPMKSTLNESGRRQGVKAPVSTPFLSL